jgi:hypothetical protein
MTREVDVPDGVANIGLEMRIESEYGMVAVPDIRLNDLRQGKWIGDL